MKKIAIFASGTGSNFQAIIDAVKAGCLHMEVALLVCDKPGALVIDKAENEKIKTFVFNPKEFETKVSFEKEIISRLQENDVDLIVLAGYMRLIGTTLLNTYKNKIINIHPSLLPSFPGKDAIGQAYRAGVKITGVTIHYVDEGMDTGPIIAQRALELSGEETLAEVGQQIHEIEHAFYPEVLQKYFVEKD
ncbi:phosphoribosylglycinamide formyltransferase [Lederbergia wuyishanensis]|uniref:Phosphoribosylglycinamide formyltransferase n=1 Tax=Lederbergia wuyishanensis TaxID=1347903 RepID=A0ABU0D4S6_9BACI|nr:phosphoribosylglycinamide formyltransferase [Lederbergia wuyishanensis]MCJ8008027.1 phosphoribosylglycinamide formyltransferase [Lederbergia wuyishanensis]MDQ0343389.1 phosphoribosylglycinamide formyltransferase-1 [Lederbergia wuyishanensis]